MGKNKSENHNETDEIFIRLDKHLKQSENIYKKTIEKSFRAGYEFARQEAKDCFKNTERRLYDYPVLKENIIKYNLDIVDLKKEKYTERSRDILRMYSGGNKLSKDDIQYVKILQVEAKKEKDGDDIAEIEAALNSVKDDEYHMVIEYKYFDRLKDTQIAELIACDESTVRRNKNRLVHRIAVKLYGSNARM